MCVRSQARTHTPTHDTHAQIQRAREGSARDVTYTHLHRVIKDATAEDRCAPLFYVISLMGKTPLFVCLFYVYKRELVINPS